MFGFYGSGASTVGLCHVLIEVRVFEMHGLQILHLGSEKEVVLRVPKLELDDCGLTALKHTFSSCKPVGLLGSSVKILIIILGGTRLERKSRTRHVRD